MKYLIATLIICAYLLTAGCASLQNAGSAHYTMTQGADANGNPTFNLDVQNGKEIATVKAHIARDGDKVTADLEEQGVAAFEGQRIAADAFKSAVAEATKAAVVAIVAAIPGLAPAAAGLAQGMAVTGTLGAAAVGAAGVVTVDKLNAAPVPAK